MAVIGQALTNPEAGWKRYDDGNAPLRYIGNWSTDTRTAGTYGGKVNYTYENTASIKFAFSGTKLRLIIVNDVGSAPTATVILNGIPEVIKFNLTADGKQVLAYEKTGLAHRIHTVEFVASGAVLGALNVNLDAIDVDSTGRVLDYDEVVDIADLEVGKRIRCHYQSTSNVVGTFSGLGEETSDFIPVASTATPNGDFYFIMVEDWNKKKILVADRHIQINISWDVLNTAGIASGSGIPINIEEKIETTVRLLTGGVAATDKDNEWDKYIVNSTLNGTIAAGDNNVWNWAKVYSLTSTTNPVSNTTRIVRGYGTVSSLTNTSTTTSTAGYGFRPVLEIETPPINKSFILLSDGYKKWVEEIPSKPPKYSNNIIPIMTSDTTPKGKAFAETVYNSSPAPLSYKAFDGDKISGYTSTIAGASSGHLGYEFSEPIIISKYALAPYNTIDGMPTDWYFEGSLNGTVWQTLDVRESVKFEPYMLKEFTIGNTNPYLMYRLRWKKNGGRNLTEINTMEMYTIIENATTAIPAYWETISTTLPDENTFISEGMDDLTVFDRKSTTFNYDLVDSGVIGEGKMFKQTIDLKKLIEIEKIGLK